eukprot:CAMPEP_0171203068 /NCGR_PEP_ID=MMETSP0790-20130122/25331_1 /TAXON_ID=2925 /ORGANISM="Alexandrium catenella, Strain OF101" /LENGTH=66 /DNA_ID=CAMNT_0011668519 /DNA_START=24 /DNA_END=220 /DNA_ORIENTATION=-
MRQVSQQALRAHARQGCDKKTRADTRGIPLEACGQWTRHAQENLPLKLSSMFHFGWPLPTCEREVS